MHRSPAWKVSPSKSARSLSVCAESLSGARHLLLCSQQTLIIMKPDLTHKAYISPMCFQEEAVWAELLCDSNSESSGSLETFDNIEDFLW